MDERFEITTHVPIRNIRYKSQALWMKALVEVNRTSYDRIIAEWKVIYRRRRGLWAEMAALKLPGL